MSDGVEGPITRADVEIAMREALDGAVRQIADAISAKLAETRRELREEIAAGRAELFDVVSRIDRRTERLEANTNLLLLQMAGMNKSLSAREQSKRALATAAADLSRGVDDLARRVGALEKKAS